MTSESLFIPQLSRLIPNNAWDWIHNLTFILTAHGKQLTTHYRSQTILYFCIHTLISMCIEDWSLKLFFFLWNLCMYTLKNIATILPQALYEDQGRSGHFTLSSCDVIFFTVMEYRLHYQSLFFIKNIPFTTTHRATLWSTQSSIPWLLGGGCSDYNIQRMKFTYTSLTLQLTMPLKIS